MSLLGRGCKGEGYSSLSDVKGNRATTRKKQSKQSGIDAEK